MNTEDFKNSIDSTINRTKTVLFSKNDSYNPGTDRLHGFKVAADLQGLTPRQALAGMMAKHTVSVYDMATSTEDFTDEQWDEKIGDHLNYLLLLRALVEDEKSQLALEGKIQVSEFRPSFRYVFTDQAKALAAWLRNNGVNAIANSHDEVMYYDAENGVANAFIRLGQLVFLEDGKSGVVLRFEPLPGD